MPFYNNGINFPNLTVKAAPTGADYMLISDSAAAGLPKQALISSLSAAGMPTTEVTGTSQALVGNNKYIMNNGALVTGTLPASPALGDLIFITGKGAGGWLIAQNANQAIHVGNQVTTTGVGGSLASTNQWDSVILQCITAGASAIWTVLGAPQGTLAGI